MVLASGGAARMEVRPGWRCGQDGGAARREVPVAEAELDEACGEPAPEFPVTETVNLSADHDLSGGGDVLDRVLGCARDALRAYGGHPDAAIEALAGASFLKGLLVRFNAKYVATRLQDYSALATLLGDIVNRRNLDRKSTRLNSSH